LTLQVRSSSQLQFALGVLYDCLCYVYGLHRDKVAAHSLGSSELLHARHNSQHTLAAGVALGITTSTASLCLQAPDSPWQCMGVHMAAGACKSWVERYCEDVDVGGGQMADCLTQHQAAADSGEDDGEQRRLCL
jgi:hypothetical protein